MTHALLKECPNPQPLAGFSETLSNDEDMIEQTTIINNPSESDQQSLVNYDAPNELDPCDKQINMSNLTDNSMITLSIADEAQALRVTNLNSSI